MPNPFFSFRHYFFMPALLLISAISSAQITTLFNFNKGRAMAQRWELDSLSKSGTFIITPYKPVYVLPVRWSSHPNGMPHSGNDNPAYTVDDNENLNNLEAKFQLSFKVKVLQDFLWGHGDLWMAYTQLSHWQLYNKSLSRPFREINYEPEIILNFATNYNVLGFKGRMLGAAFNHESNGRDTPLSRSWNRIMLIAGFERDEWQVYIRPWYRMRGEKKEDDNPDIVDYMGRGDVTVIYGRGKSSLAFTGRHNFSFNNPKGYGELSWSYQISGNLKGHLQVATGYGETLIDYNNYQTTVGIGVSLIEW